MQPYELTDYNLSVYKHLQVQTKSNIGTHPRYINFRA